MLDEAFGGQVYRALCCAERRVEIDQLARHAPQRVVVGAERVADLPQRQSTRRRRVRIVAVVDFVFDSRKAAHGLRFNASRIETRQTCAWVA